MWTTEPACFSPKSGAYRSQRGRTAECQASERPSASRGLPPKDAQILAKPRRRRGFSPLSGAGSMIAGHLFSCLSTYLLLRTLRQLYCTFTAIRRKCLISRRAGEGNRTLVPKIYACAAAFFAGLTSVVSQVGLKDVSADPGLTALLGRPSFPCAFSSLRNPFLGDLLVRTSRR